MLTLSSADTSPYTEGVSAWQFVLAVIFRGKVSQEMYSSVHSSTMVGKLVLKCWKMRVPVRHLSSSS